MKNNLLITGADGYLGQRLTEQYLSDPNLTLLLWVRADNTSEFEHKRVRLLKTFSHASARIKIVASNLLADKPYDGIDPRGITGIIHTAAVTRFNVEPELADTVNREGTRKTLEFARQCPNLERFAYISTVYSAGLTTGAIDEVIHDPAGPFANHYERSKCESEWLLHTEYRDLPWHIYRAATIIADDDSGEVSQYNVFHNTLRLLFHGLISLIPGFRTTPIYLTTGAFTSNSIFHISRSDEPQHRIYNICYPEDIALSLGTLIDRVFVNFSSNEEFSKRRILKPLFTDLEAFESLAEALKGLSGEVVKQALDSIRPFSKQLFINKAVHNGNLRAAYPDYQAPDMLQLADNVTQYLMASKWGREPKIPSMQRAAG